MIQVLTSKLQFILGGRLYNYHRFTTESGAQSEPDFPFHYILRFRQSRYLTDLTFFSINLLIFLYDVGGPDLICFLSIKTASDNPHSL